MPNENCFGPALRPIVIVGHDLAIGASTLPRKIAGSSPAMTRRGAPSVVR